MHAYIEVKEEQKDNDGTYQSGTVLVAGLKTKYLSPSDMVLPLMCGICTHLVYIGILIPIVVLYYDDYRNLDACINVHFDVLLVSLFVVHVLILLTDCIATCNSFTAKASGTNKCLNGALMIRLVLNVAEILLVFYGVYTVFIDQNNVNCNWRSDGNIVYILIVLFLAFNFTMIITTWCCLWCCLGSTSPTRNDDKNDDKNCLYSCFSAILYDDEASKVTSHFHGMGGLINILSSGTQYTPAEIITGLHLLRMLQKYYGKLDENYDLNPNYKALAPDDDQLIEECIYYTLCANAAYGIPLHSMTHPCFICCAPPCCLPSHFDDKYSDKTIHECDKIVLRENKCCYPIQIDNSSFKTFIQRTECKNPQNDILLVSQIGGLHQVNFYVVIDRNKQCLVISLRGTLSIGDSITDANTEPELFDEYIQTDIKCYVHKGIGQCAKDTFNKIMDSKSILNFITNDEYKHYGVIINGHSLGGGTTVLLSLMFKYGSHENLKYFINDNRKIFKAYAIAPPAVVDQNFAIKKKDEISQFLICVIYNHDMIPRLSFNNLITTRASITILLEELNKTSHGPWWVYKKSMTLNKNTILDALPNDCEYINNKNVNIQDYDYEDEEQKRNNNNDDPSEILLPKLSGEACFINEVNKQVELIKQKYNSSLKKYLIIDDDEDDDEDDEDDEYKNSDLYKNNYLLWNTKFSQTGNILFVTKVIDTNNDSDNNNNECIQCIGNMCNFIGKSMIGNMCRSRCCLDSQDTKYKAYIADIGLFCDHVIFSKNMMPDHMPHVYLDVLKRLTD